MLDKVKYIKKRRAKFHRDYSTNSASTMSSTIKNGTLNKSLLKSDLDI